MIRKAADLFCGAGGTSTGYVRACQQHGLTPELLAINHWPTAVKTHELNHPGVRHLCENLETVQPSRVVPGGRLDLLCASPECTHFSLAAGGRPRNDQSRAQAWQVLRWATDLTIDNILIENVREFEKWGPLNRNGKPSKRKCGQFYRAFIEGLRNIGYTVDRRILCAADFGDPTTRQRLFIIGRRGKAIHWPKASHSKGGAHGLKPWRAAREIIDWDLKGESIFRRKRPLSANTMRRIAAGLRKFGGTNAEPFLVMLYGTNDARSVDRPAPTITGGGNHVGLAQPFVIQTDQTGGNGAYVRSTEQPLFTTVTKQNMALIEPFLVPPRHMNGGTVDSVEKPLRTVTGAAGRNFGLVQPFAVSVNHGEGDDTRRSHSLDEPFPTVDCSNGKALVQPMIIGQQSDAAARPVSQPCPTVATAGAIALVQPYIVKYYGSGVAVGLDEPLDTVTTRDRFMLICPTTHQPVAELDILFRMLQPHELSAAQGFPADYQFAGSREERVKQIGNAVPVGLSTALCASLLK